MGAIKRLIDSIMVYWMFMMIALVVHESSSAIDLSRCGTEKGCLVNPLTCYNDSRIRCDTIFTYKRDGEVLTMELYGIVDDVKSAYVAIGFSTDRFMSDDAVTDCSISPGFPLQGRLSYNVGKLNYRISIPDNKILLRYLRTVSTETTDNSIYCMIRQNITPMEEFIVPPEVVPLTKPYFLLLAKGRTNEKGFFYQPNNSSLDFFLRSDRPVDLLEFPSKNLGNTVLSYKNLTYYRYTLQLRDDLNATNIKFRTHNDAKHQQYAREEFRTNARHDSVIDFFIDSSRRNTEKMKQIHGALMCPAWMIFFTLGMLSARYHRRYWSGEAFNSPIWFIMHRLFNSIGIILTIIALIFIFSAMEWRWSGPKIRNSYEANRSWKSMHAMLGLLSCVISWAQPLNAVFRCDSESSCRKIFRLIHQTLGYSAWIMAVSAVLIATKRFEKQFADAGTAFVFVLAYIISVAIFVIPTEIFHIITWLIRMRSAAAVGDSSLDGEAADENIPNFGRIKIALLVIAAATCVIVLCSTTSIIFLVLLADPLRSIFDWNGTKYFPTH